MFEKTINTKWYTNPSAGDVSIFSSASFWNMRKADQVRLEYPDAGDLVYTLWVMPKKRKSQYSEDSIFSVAGKTKLDESIAEVIKQSGDRTAYEFAKEIEIIADNHALSTGKFVFSIDSSLGNIYDAVNAVLNAEKEMQALLMKYKQAS